MAKKQKVPTGSTIKFTGYAEESTAEDPLHDKVGTILKVTGFDKEDGTYNVEGDDIEDSLYDDEFEVEEAAKPATKKTAAKKTAAKKTAAKKTAAKKAATKKATTSDKKAEEKAKAKEAAAAKKLKEREKAAEEKAKLDALPTFKKTTTITSTLKEYEGDALQAAYDYAEDQAKGSFVLGGLLAFIKRGNLQNQILSEEQGEDGEYLPYYDADLKGFNSYVDETLGIKAVKAAFLVRIYETFSQITTEKKIESVGWTKLRELLPLGDALTKENVDEWLKSAKELTTAELHESVKTELVDSGAETHGNKNKAKQVTRKLVFFEDQDNVVKEAIDIAKDAIGGEDVSDSQAFAHIAQVFLDLSQEEAEAGEE